MPGRDAAFWMTWGSPARAVAKYSSSSAPAANLNPPLASHIVEHPTSEFERGAHSGVAFEIPRRPQVGCQLVAEVSELVAAVDEVSFIERIVHERADRVGAALTAQREHQVQHAV